MHRTFTVFALLALVSVLAAAAASTAGAATPSVAALARQVAALNKKVTVLQAQVTKLKKTQATDEQDILGFGALTFCTMAATADAFTGTWAVVDQIPGGPLKFGPQPTALDDKGLCEALKVPRPQPVPPTLSAFQTLLALLGSPNPFTSFQALPAWASGR
jgi:hypothetical protein